ncbi:hypothetical protein BJ508DRAFT_327023 [Ascobolus immersus RN42]|uniref:Uncharacterized protein n=1 Tax=Ascobolus immersus RN42 TaxID=1160509 RepID=A0A3N4I3I4_ASCIM|nr:hypothetical protein BJ508DRAFT_327023 [Ascobolus immersus RN42]
MPPRARGRPRGPSRRTAPYTKQLPIPGKPAEAHKTEAEKKREEEEKAQQAAIKAAKAKENADKRAAQIAADYQVYRDMVQAATEAATVQDALETGIRFDIAAEGRVLDMGGGEDAGAGQTDLEPQELAAAQSPGLPDLMEVDTVVPYQETPEEMKRRKEYDKLQLLIRQATTVEGQNKYADEDPITAGVFRYPPAPTRIVPLQEDVFLDITELEPPPPIDPADVNEMARLAKEERVQTSKRKKPRLPKLPNPGIVAISALWIKNNGARAKWVDLAKSFQLLFIAIPPQIRETLEPFGILNIPATTYMLHRWTALLPGSGIKQREIKVDTKTLQAGLPSKREPYKPCYFIDKLELLQLFYKNPVIRSQLYTGRQRLVDFARNLYEARIWGESAMLMFGKYVFYRLQSSGATTSVGLDEPMLPGDIIYYKGHGNVERLGRIRQIVEDHRSATKNKGSVLAVVENIVRVSELPDQPGVTRADYDNLIQNGFNVHGRTVIPKPDDYVMLENPVYNVPVSRILYRIQAVYTDGPDEISLLSGPRSSRPDVLRIRYILRTVHRFSFRTAVHRHHLRAEMEIANYKGGRRAFIMDFVLEVRGRVYVMATMMFIDGFGLYQMGVYIILAGMDIHMRRSHKNWFTLMVGSMGTTTYDAAEILRPAAKRLWEGKDMVLFAFDIAMLGDMPQQNKNAGIVGPTGYCLASREDRLDLSYDANVFGRYHHIENQKRDRICKAKTKGLQTFLYTRAGMVEAGSVFTAGQPAFDPQRMLPTDPCHIVSHGIGRQMHNILVEKCTLKRSENFLAQTYGPSYSILTGTVLIWVYSTYARLQFLIFQEAFSDEMRVELHERITEWIVLFRRFARLMPAGKKEDIEGDETRLSMLPNLHGFGHLYEICDLYATLVNALVSPGEQKHGEHKKKAKASNKRAVDKQILLRAEILLRIRMAVNGTFEKEAPELTECLRTVVTAIPEIMDGITPKAGAGVEKLVDDGEMDTEINNFTVNKRQRETKRDMDSWPRMAKKDTKIRMFFADKLKHDENYEPITDTSPDFYVRYFHQTSFNIQLPNSKLRRITLNAGRIYQLSGNRFCEVVIFAGAILSEDPESKEYDVPIIAIVRMLYRRLENDPVMDVPIYEMRSISASPEQAVSIHEFTTTPCYFIPASVRDPTNTLYQLSDSTEALFWHCNWLVPKI